MKTLCFLMIFLFTGLLQASSQKIDGLYVNTFGNKSHPSIIFVHGGPGHNSYDFEITTAQRLSDEGFYVVVYDQRGQGRSDQTLPINFNYKTYAYDIKTLIDRLGLNSPILLGHSHGGPVSINFDRFYPGVAKSIILTAAPINFWGSIKSIYENCAKNYSQSKNSQSLEKLTYLYYELFNNPSPNYAPEFLIGSSFIHGIQCGLYNTSKPNQKAKNLKALIQQNPLSQPLSGMTTAMPGFLKNENYVKGNYAGYVFTQKGRYFGIYADEDGLFTPLELSLIKTMVHTNDGIQRYELIKGSSHSIFIDQQDEFIRLIKQFSK